MFRFFRNKEAEAINHWFSPIANFTASTKDFYEAIERELKEQQLPGLETCRVEFLEGNVLTAKREYLRMTRDRMIFDICAAPFGHNYFYSCRFAELPVRINLFALLMLFILFIILSGLSLRIFGFLFFFFFWPILTFSLVYLLRNAVSLGLSDLDAWLLKQPLIGPIYERIFRKETYYRHDTRLMYLTVVDNVVKKLVEEETSAKGVKLLTQYEHAPILGELYKRTQKVLEDQSDTVSLTNATF